MQFGQAAGGVLGAAPRRLDQHREASNVTVAQQLAEVSEGTGEEIHQFEDRIAFAVVEALTGLIAPQSAIILWEFEEYQDHVSF